MLQVVWFGAVHGLGLHVSMTVVGTHLSASALNPTSQRHAGRVPSRTQCPLPQTTPSQAFARGSTGLEHPAAKINAASGRLLSMVRSPERKPHNTRSAHGFQHAIWHWLFG